MQTEFEAMFIDINPEEIINSISKNSGKLVKEKYTQIREVFDFPEGHHIQNGFIRVRKESNKTTMTIKVMESNNQISGQKELELIIDDFEKGSQFLSFLGAKKRSKQVNQRQLFKLNNCEIMIDYWPFLNPIIEIEGPNEKEVVNTCKLLDLDYSKAIFDSIDYVYSQKYNKTKQEINQTPEISFEIQNPFID